MGKALDLVSDIDNAVDDALRELAPNAVKDETEALTAHVDTITAKVGALLKYTEALEKDSAILSALNEHGVDNWAYYDEALETVRATKS